jgi:hypothetical protein
VVEALSGGVAVTFLIVQELGGGGDTSIMDEAECAPATVASKKMDI